MDSESIQIYHSTIYNTTDNSLSERINKDIGTILRIYKNQDLNIIKCIIENRLNKTYNTNLKNTPHYILNNKPYARYEMKNHIDKSNMNRKEHEYRNGDLILIKNQNRKAKTDDLFYGPFEIVETQNNYVTLKDSNNKTLKHNFA